MLGTQADQVYESALPALITLVRHLPQSTPVAHSHLPQSTPVAHSRHAITQAGHSFHSTVDCIIAASASLKQRPTARSFSHAARQQALPPTPHTCSAPEHPLNLSITSLCRSLILAKAACAMEPAPNIRSLTISYSECGNVAFRSNPQASARIGMPRTLQRHACMHGGAPRKGTKIVFQCQQHREARDLLAYLVIS